MYLALRVNGQMTNIDMQQAGAQVVTVGEYQYHPNRMASKLQKLTTLMWGRDAAKVLLGDRLCFEAMEPGRAGNHWGDSGSFAPATGSQVLLGRWDEQGTIGIALHELAHDMHLRGGGYDHSDGFLRESLALLAEREAGLKRTFDREPYYTASNLVREIHELGAFQRLSFARRWEEMSALTNDVGLADLTNYYLDRSERLGLGRWLKQYSDQEEVRDTLLNALAVCSLRYSLDYRRILLNNVVRCEPTTPVDKMLYLLQSVITLDKRYPEDDLGNIIEFCFAPLARPQRRLAFG